MSRPAPLPIVATLLLALACTSPPEREVLRVGTSGDYLPFSTTTREGVLTGLDVSLARAFAADRGRVVEFVRFRWPELHADLAAGRFDLVWSGVTVRPERSVIGRFSVPYLESGAVLLVREEDDRAPAEPGRRIAVNRGGHLERVARASFPDAELITLPANERVLGELLEGRADAVLTDTLEAPGWMTASPVRLRAIGPLTRDRKAVWIRADRPELARNLDAWLVAREADGSLARFREEAGIAEAWASAEPRAALEAALEERLSLIPFVAEAKRRSGAPVEVPEREAVVIRAGQRAVARAAEEAGAAPPAPAAVAAFYREQIEASKARQREVLAGPTRPGEAPDLATELRPALLRIGEKIAWLLVRVGIPEPPGAPQHSAPTREGAGDEPGKHRQPQRDPVAQQGEARAEDRHLPGHQAMKRQQGPRRQERHHGRR